MELIHSAATAAIISVERVDPGKLFESDGEGMLGGAVEREGDSDDLIERYYEAFSIHHMDTIAAGCDWFVTGNYYEMIEELLEDRHRPLLPQGCSCLQRVENFTIRGGLLKPTQRGYSQEVKARKIISGWLIHDRPFTKETSAEMLMQLSARVGPVIIPESTYDALGEVEGLNEDGFTARERRSGAWQINYNPAAIRRRPYLKKRREVTRYLEGSFPDDLLHHLTHCLHPDWYPPGHPFKSVAKGKAMSEQRGWGNCANVACDETDVIAYRDLTLKLWPRQYWWRERDAGYHQREHTFIGYVEEALKYIHGVEDHIAKELEKRKVSAKQNYDWDLSENVIGPTMTYERFEEDYLYNHGGARLAIVAECCLWLRREARAMKIKQPKRPVMPLSPRDLAREAKRKIQARAAARKARREKRKP